MPQLSVAASPSAACLAPKIAIFVPFASIKAGWTHRTAYANAIDALRVSSTMPSGDGTIVCAWVERRLLAAATSCVCSARRQTAAHVYQRSSLMYQLEGRFCVFGPVRILVQKCLDFDPGLMRRYGPYPACPEDVPVPGGAAVALPLPDLALEAQLLAICEAVV